MVSHVIAKSMLRRGTGFVTTSPPSLPLVHTPHVSSICTLCSSFNHLPRQSRSTSSRYIQHPNLVRCCTSSSSSSSSSTISTDDDGVVVRIATPSDVDGMAALTAAAFVEQDVVLAFLQQRARHNVVVHQVASAVRRLFLRMSVLDVSWQLQKRIGDNNNQQKQSQSKRNKVRAHFVLLAQDVQTGRILGCVEVGMVGKSKVNSGNSAAISTIDQWEKSIAQAESQSQSTQSESEESDSDSESEESDSDSESEKVTSLLVDKVVYIGNLAVDKEYRRCGIASKLIQGACQQSSTLWNAHCVWLHVESCNEGAVRLYKKLDFGCQSKDPDWVSEVGRRQRLLLRSEGGETDWRNAKVTGVKLNAWEYLRWCWNDLSRTRNAGK